MLFGLKDVSVFRALRGGHIQVTFVVMKTWPVGGIDVLVGY